MERTSEVDLETCAELQREEWEVLESIYPDCVSTGLSQDLLKLEVPIELSEPTKILPSARGSGFVNTSSSSADTDEDSAKQEETSPQILSTLPPVLIEFLLPSTYPLRDPPRIVSLHATYSWLIGSLIAHLQRLLIERWVEGEGILYTWVEYIRSGEFLDELRLKRRIGKDSTIRLPHPNFTLLIPLLSAYDASIQLMHFSQNSYNCEICLTSIKGARCILLSCSHVFCRSCLEDFWKLCIAEGDITRVGCPDPGCVKEAREAKEDEVRRVVTEEEVKRWKWLREKRILEKDPTMVHCPVPFCQTPVAMTGEYEEGSGWERLRTCPQCDYSFCAYCKHGWHGPISPCPIYVTDTFVTEYIKLENGTREKEMMERRYGKSRLQKLVKQYEEEQATKDWLSESTTSCPNCRVSVEKSMGCNHMTCSKCGQHFCYRCGDRLNAASPYKHFSTPGRSCFNKLFDQESLEWEPMLGDEFY
ncbi:hypothetical protein ABKN59_006187 [Abortiporus biennis]